jgi:hypothetical protein
MLKARNRILPNSTTLNNNGIQIHGGLVPHFFTTITNGALAKSSNDDYTFNKICAYNSSQISYICKEWINPYIRLVENSFLYNKVWLIFEIFISTIHYDCWF